MWKSILAGTAALAIAGSTLVYAQQRGDGAQRWRPSAADFSAMSDARIAGLKEGLKLTPEQEKNWPAVETALRDLAKQRADRLAARASAPRSTDLIERLRNRADGMARGSENLKKLADAAQPLYQSLDESQKHRFAMLARLGGGGSMGHHWRGHHHRQQ